MFKAYIFDLDGTLINSIAQISTCFNNEIKKCGFKCIEEKHFNYFVGDGPKILVDRAFEYIINRDSLNYSAEELDNIKRTVLENYLNSYINAPSVEAKLYPGIKEALKYLKENNKKIAVCTNKPLLAAKNILENIFGKNYFDCIVGLENEAHKKPNPYMINIIIEKLNLKNKDIVYFGDTSTDMITAKNVNVYAVGVLWGFREKEELLRFGADKIIENPLDIKRI
ncbi:HAD family hydrolase [Peptostreptococcaceae bacterium OttesenSCG-928-C18]|nr:HAD family hydrolase [Peptostreptococcaceae bacterium OttesenSCG-928-C18]